VPRIAMLVFVSLELLAERATELLGTERVVLLALRAVTVTDPAVPFDAKLFLVLGALREEKRAHGPAGGAGGGAGGLSAATAVWICAAS